MVGAPIPSPLSGMPSVTGGDARSSASASQRTVFGDSGGIFSPMYVGGSGGGLPGGFLTIIFGLGLAWLVHKYF